MTPVDEARKLLAKRRRKVRVEQRQLRGARRAVELAKQKLARRKADAASWGGSRAVTDEIIDIVAGRAPVSSRKRAASDPLSKANPGSDHNEANVLADAVDFRIADAHGLKNEIASKLTGGRIKMIADFVNFEIVRNGARYRVQLIAGTHGTGPHLHAGVRRV
jgi:hypothetical protein